MEEFAKKLVMGVGAITLVKAAPVLAAGVAIGSVIANPEKAKKNLKAFSHRVEEGVSSIQEKFDAFTEKYVGNFDLDETLGFENDNVPEPPVAESNKVQDSPKEPEPDEKLFSSDVIDAAAKLLEALQNQGKNK